jgi:WD40 repeat protein
VSDRPLYALALSRDGKRLAVGGADGQVSVFALWTGKRLHQFEGHSEGVYSLAFAPAGDRLLSGSGDCCVRVWKLAGPGKDDCLAGHADAVYQVAFSADGGRILSAGVDGQVLVRDAGSGHILHSHRFPGKALCAAITPDGRQVGTGTGRATCYLMELPRRAR